MGREMSGDREPKGSMSGDINFRQARMFKTKMLAEIERDHVMIKGMLTNLHLPSI